MISVALTWLTPFAAGTSLVWLLAPRHERVRAPELLIRILLGMASGIGISFFAYMLLMFANVRSPATVLATEALIAVLLLFFCWRKRTRAPHVPALDEQGQPRPLLWGLLALAFIVALCSWLRFIPAALQATPEGDWDAWAMWNMKAKFLASDDWLPMFHPVIPHADYPLLLPSWIARGWIITGQQTHASHHATALLFTLGTVVLIFASLARVRSLSHGLLAATILLGCNAYAGHGSTQYADVPQAFFFLVTFACLAQYDVSGGHPGWLVLTGVSAGMASSTKCEGIAFLVPLSLSLMLVLRMHYSTKEMLRRVAYFAAGVAPQLLLTLGIQKVLAPPSWLVTKSNPLTPFQRLMSSERHALVLSTFRGLFKAFGDFAGFLGPYLLLFYSLVTGIRVRKGHIAPWIVLLTVIGNALIVYLVYVITPEDLNWHLGTSAARLFTQSLPGVIYVLFLWLETPESIAAAEGRDSTTSPVSSPSA